MSYIRNSKGDRFTGETLFQIIPLPYETKAPKEKLGGPW
jgi:hypothetical protein